MAWHAHVAAAILTGIVALAKPAAAEPPCSYSPKWTAMRPQTTQLARLVDTGMQRSPTLRQLAQEVERHCGVVFISGMDLALARRRAIGVTAHQVTIVGRFRYLYIVVDTRSGSAEVISTIGHELQHVVEVLESGATTPAEIGGVFNRIGVRLGHGVFETATAAQLGAKVRREVQD